MIYAIKKIWKYITASANDFADQIEDHEKNGRQAIRKLNSEINKTRDIIIETMVSYRTLEAKYDGLNKDLVSQKAKLDSYISKNDDISAKEIFKTYSTTKALVDNYKIQMESINTKVEYLNNVLTKLNANKERIEMEINVAMARINVAKVTQTVNTNMSSLGNSIGINVDLQELNEAVIKEEVRAEVLFDINNIEMNNVNDPALDKEFDEYKKSI